MSGRWTQVGGRGVTRDDTLYDVGKNSVMWVVFFTMLGWSDVATTLEHDGMHGVT